MFGHAPELVILFVLLLVFAGGIVGLVWLFGLAVGEGIARGQERRR